MTEEEILCFVLFVLIPKLVDISYVRFNANCFHVCYCSTSKPMRLCPMIYYIIISRGQSLPYIFFLLLLLLAFTWHRCQDNFIGCLRNIVWTEEALCPMVFSLSSFSFPQRLHAMKSTLLRLHHNYALSYNPYNKIELCKSHPTWCVQYVYKVHIDYPNRLYSLAIHHVLKIWPISCSIFNCSGIEYLDSMVAHTITDSGMGSIIKELVGVNRTVCLYSQILFS